MNFLFSVFFLNLSKFEVIVHNLTRKIPSNSIIKVFTFYKLTYVDSNVHIFLYFKLHGKSKNTKIKIQNCFCFAELKLKIDILAK